MSGWYLPIYGIIKVRVIFAGGVLDQDSLTGIHVINKGMDKADQGYEANMRHVRNTTTASGICMMVPERNI